MYFRQLRQPDIGCASYIVGGDGVCAVIDPRWDAVSQYVGLARQQGMQITHILETHTHADHVSGATRLAARTGATILIHHHAMVTYAHCDVDDNEEMVIGSARMIVIHTPGHSLDSISVLVIDVEGNEPPRLLSGDTLFVGEVGRPDLHGNQGVNLTELLHISLHEHILPLGDEVEVYPAHLAGSLCGRNIAPSPSTTIGHERLTNPALTLLERETFVRIIMSDLPPRPPNAERIVQLNRSGAPGRRPKVTRVTPEEARALLDQVALIDGRDALIFAQGHLRGAINIPIGYGQFGIMVAWLLSPEKTLLLIPDDAEDLGDAIDSLMVVGMTNPLLSVTGDQEVWKGAGLPITETTVVNVEDLAQRIANGKLGTLVDVREKGEMEQGTLMGAINLPYREIRTRETLPHLVEPIAVFCNSGNRSSLAASLLERLGLSVLNVAGGTTAWMEAGLPLALLREEQCFSQEYFR
jgi:glyoxylase-like metal-dependent hydrolase (beta-lactamase superfamily II)/rhodanese-related sulfurtransferase